MLAHEVPLKLRREEMHAKPESERGHCKHDKNDADVRRELTRVPQFCAGEVRVAQKLPECIAADEPEQRQRGDAHGRKAIRKRQDNEEREEFGDQQAARHGGLCF